MSASMLWTGGWTVVKVPSKLVTASAGACRCAGLRGDLLNPIDIYLSYVGLSENVGLIFAMK